MPAQTPGGMVLPLGGQGGRYASPGAPGVRMRRFAAVRRFSGGGQGSLVFGDGPGGSGVLVRQSDGKNFKQYQQG